MTKNLRRIEPTESQIQQSIVEWANNTINNEGYRIGDFLIKIPNEGKRSFYIVNKMKKEGLKKGVSDLFLAYPYFDYFKTKSMPKENIDKFKYTKLCGLWLEVKSKNGRVSDSQKSFIVKMTEIGYWATHINNVDDGIAVIKDYLGMK